MPAGEERDVGKGDWVRSLSIMREFYEEFQTRGRQARLGISGPFNELRLLTEYGWRRFRFLCL
jgi:hypothetical protein